MFSPYSRFAPTMLNQYGYTLACGQVSTLISESESIDKVWRKMNQYIELYRKKQLAKKVVAYR